jgi:hypothetical protein
MRKLLSLVISGLLVTTTLVAITSPQASAAPTLTTCTNLETGKTLVLRSADAQCRSHLGSALWVQEQSDSPSRTGDGYATITVCSSKNPFSTYRFIKDSCPKFQVTTNYWRTVAAPATPVIEAASARGHDSAALFIAPLTSAPSAPVLYYLVTDIGSGEVRRVAPSNRGYLNLSGLSAESTYTFTIAAVNVDGSSAASLATPVIRTGTAPVVATTAPVALTCATGGTCVVGDRGPGGGIVYYVSATPFTSAGSTCNTTCKYLEVAPAGWNNGAVVADDPPRAWSTNTSLTTGQDTVTAGTESAFAGEKFNWKIGQGFYNTSVMKVAGATSTAQAAVLAYAGGSTAGQWFIPSMNELNELCKYARGQTTGDPTVACTSGGTFKSTANAGTDLGGFVSTFYWSSSESGSRYSHQQSFFSGTQDFNWKYGAWYVRPVRAF